MNSVPRRNEPLVPTQFRVVNRYVAKCDSAYLTSSALANVKIEIFFHFILISVSPIYDSAML